MQSIGMDGVPETSSCKVPLCGTLAVSLGEKETKHDKTDALAQPIQNACVALGPPKLHLTGST
jgi:hypothetical protein